MEIIQKHVQQINIKLVFELNILIKEANIFKIIPNIDYSTNRLNPYIIRGATYNDLQSVKSNLKNGFVKITFEDIASSPYCNKGIIKKLQDKITKEHVTSNSLKKIYKDHTNSLNGTLDNLKEVISEVYHAYADYYNVEVFENRNYVSVFSFINCNIFTIDINSILNTIKIN